MSEIQPQEDLTTVEGAKGRKAENKDTKDETEEVDLDAEVLKRGVWGRQCEFYLSALGYTVGLGNVWRFPYLCFKNGGGAFLLPYFLFLILGGIPLVFLEMSLGQYTSTGPTLIWKAAPIFKGVGIAMVLVSGVVSVYYNMIVAWSLFYLFGSMQSRLPWTTCDNAWNTEYCCAFRRLLENCSYYADVEYNSSCVVCLHEQATNNTNLNISRVAEVFMYNETTRERDVDANVSTGFSTPASEYFENNVLKLSDGPSELGQVQWALFLCLVAAWLLTFICLVRGIRSSGKVVYVTSLLPYVLLLILLIQSARLPGAKEGVIFYLRPDWSRLADATVWRDAATQTIFSLSICFGGIITLSSYNRFDHNCYRDAITIPLLNSLTSIFAGFVVFTTLGHMAYLTGSPIDAIVQSGVGFAFIVYPEALANLQGPVAMSVLFFTMLVMLGVDSQFVFVHTITQSFVDEFPQYFQKRKIWVLLAVCCLLLLLGIPLTTQAGLHFVQVLDVYATGWTVLAIGFLECVVFAWVYGYSRLTSDIWTMIGKRPGRWWKYLWQFITPMMMLFVSIFSMIDPNSETSDEDSLSKGSKISGWVIACLIMLIIPVWAIVAFIKAEGSLLTRVKELFKPAKDWGPKWNVDDCLWTIPEYMRSEKEDTDRLTARRMTSFDESVSVASGLSSFKGGYHAFGGQDGENIDTGSIAWSEDENKIRGNWTGRFDFLFSTLGYSVGIGNVWRFPYLVYKNGGGAFFFPYLIILFLVGLPLFFMDIAFGQFASRGPLTIWRVSPIFKGIGYASIVTMFFVCIYYNIINAWSVYYLFASMQSELPWATCNNTWNTEKCRLRSEMDVRFDNCSTYYPLPDYNSSELFYTDLTSPSYTTIMSDIEQSTMTIEAECVNRTENLRGLFNTPSFEYFFNVVIGLSGGVGDIGAPQWHLALCLLFCWLVTFVSLIKGVKSAGKVVYFTVSFPYIVLLILLVRYATLDSGAYLDGLKYYVTPQWDRLGDATVWGDAASQVFFSLGLSQGGLIALSSYNRFHYDCYKDAYIVCIVDTLTSVFAGFVIFAILGVMAKESGVAVDEVVESSFALAYVAYPEAVTKLPVSSVWSILFFLMLFSLAIDTEFLMMESIIIAIIDEYPEKLAKRRVWVILVLCIVMFVLGLPMVCQGGMYILVLMDTYTAAWSPLIIGVCMCIALAWVYKVENFQSNIKSMLGNEPSIWWKLLWKYITPFLLIWILIFQWVRYQAPTLDGYVYPVWAHTLALLLSLTAPLCIPLYILIRVVKNMRRSSCSKEALLKDTSPETEWGPALEKHRNASYLPGVTDQEKIDSIANWIVKGQVFHTDSSKDVIQKKDESTGVRLEEDTQSCHSVDDRGSVTHSIGSTSKSSGTDYSGRSQSNECLTTCKSGAHQVTGDSITSHRKHRKEKQQKAPLDVKKREKNTKGFNVTFPDEKKSSLGSDYIYVKRPNKDVPVCDQIIQTDESYLRSNRTIVKIESSEQENDILQEELEAPAECAVEDEKTAF